MANSNVANVEVPERINGNLVIVRKEFKDKNGKPILSKQGRVCYGYMVEGKVRGRSVKADIVPKDQGGYEPLDIVFDVSPKAELIVEEGDMDLKNGKKSHYVRYKARTIDEDGVVFECGVKPQNDSDKSLLEMLLGVITR